MMHPPTPLNVSCVPKQGQGGHFGRRGGQAKSSVQARPPPPLIQSISSVAEGSEVRSRMSRISVNGEGRSSPVPPEDEPTRALMSHASSFAGSRKQGAVFR